MKVQLFHLNLFDQLQRIFSNLNSAAKKKDSRRMFATTLSASNVTRVLLYYIVPIVSRIRSLLSCLTYVETARSYYSMRGAARKEG